MKKRLKQALQLRVDSTDSKKIIEALGYYLASWKETEGYLGSGVIYDGPIHYDCDSAWSAYLQVEQVRGALRRWVQEVKFARRLQTLDTEKPDFARKIYWDGTVDGQDNFIQKVVNHWDELQKLNAVELQTRLLKLKDQRSET